ncbi:cupin domain-containing protein [Streptomyces sp. ISL-10]|uniref:cupin domain-containing protein n=1 Tax=Streptomyces sp. ISL-10 TaxID=2819172 RepID=UPI001BE95562|nr:cupin domain-containing protein [Streptomyces sp. ISL-10]MBT2365875.1 cupin domain-containing protein [Streptomyces sp. ISL-10]
MKKVHRTDVKAEVVREPGAKEALHRKLIDTPDGADRFVLTEFELAPNGSTPPHYHEWEHEIYVIDGSMGLVMPGESRTEQVGPGDAVFIPRNEPHGFVTGPDQSCRFLVVAPCERPPVRNFFLSDDPYEYTQLPEYASSQEGK